MRSRYLELAICLFLAAATLAIYWQVMSHDFVNYDDYDYVTENPYVRTGLSKRSITWAFTSFHVGNWHPLTWLSHMLDCELFGLKPGMHHLTNLLFHMANSILLFVVLRRMTGSIWRSGFVAVLFALHPLHVESVVWVAERKDVLSTLFWMLTMWAYVRYSESPGVIRYLLVLVFFVLGLMAKPMLVTLPFVLLLIDYWPLARLQLDQFGNENNISLRKSILHLILEKVPLFALSGTISVVTVIAFQKAGGGPSLGDLPLQPRIANALVSFLSYIQKMIWPGDLAVFYPLPRAVPMWKAAGAGLLLTCLSIIFLRAVRSRPYLSVGWLWYLGSLVPVIGVVQGGGQAMADRYTYIPLIGLYVMIAWSVPGFVKGWRFRSVALAISAGLVLSVLMLSTWRQIRHWKDSITLFKHTLDMTTENFLAHNNLGVALDKQGRHDEAIRHYREALDINPGWAKAHYNLGLVKAGQGKFAEAIEAYSESIRLKPNSPKTHNNMANALLSLDRVDSAIEHYFEAIKARPDYANAHSNLGIALTRQGNTDDAILHFKAALRINPDDARIRHNLDQALKQRHRERTE